MTTTVVWQYRCVFGKMEEDGLLDIANDIHLYCLHYVFLPRLNYHLQTFSEAWDNHPLSSEGNHTPNEMWFRGMIARTQCGCLDEIVPEVIYYYHECNEIS